MYKNGAMSEWQWLTMNDNEWQWVTMSDNELTMSWQWVDNELTMSDK